MWFGWSGHVSADALAVARREQSGSVDYAVVDLTPDEFRDFYIGYSNGVLWPACHGLPRQSGDESRWYAAYCEVNRRYAEGVRALLQPDDLIWVHDYHLLPLASFLRSAGSRHRTGFFLHVPFPRRSALQTIQAHGELLDSLLAYDVLGVQTDADLAALHDAVRRRWGAAAVGADGVVSVDRYRIATGIFPVGVDVDAIRSEVNATPRQGTCRWDRWAAAPARAIGADRLDESKGLRQRFVAYERLLAAITKGEPSPTLLQIATPPRIEDSGHAALQAAVEEATARINARSADMQHAKIYCHFGSLPHAKLMQLFASANVGIVTPVCDGMNLVAKEFVAAQHSESPGVLVLSIHAGAARELDAALLVDPRDSDAMASAMARAFRMPLAERRERHQALIAALRSRSLEHWYEGFLAQLARAPARG